MILVFFTSDCLQHIAFLLSMTIGLDFSSNQIYLLKISKKITVLVGYRCREFALPRMVGRGIVGGGGQNRVEQ